MGIISYPEFAQELLVLQINGEGKMLRNDVFTSFLLPTFSLFYFLHLFSNCYFFNIREYFRFSFFITNTFSCIEKNKV